MNKVLKSLMVSLLMVMSGMAFASGEHWITDPGQYSENTIFVGIITVDGNEQRSDYLEIGAFCNDECRGSVLCTYEPDFDRYLAYLTVNGEDGMVMNLKIWDHTTGTQLRVNRDARFTFVADDIKGSPDNPYTFAFTTAYDFSSDGLRYRINDDGETVTVVGPDSESFEKGFPTGWSQIDADGDGYGWAILGENTHSGSSCVSSASWVNDVGPLYPDNYLVSPLLSLKGNMAFYVCAQDASYAAEHFGVAVSTGSQTNPADFSMLAEWTLSAKGGSQSNGPRGSRDAGSWYEYSIDLSSYEGQNGYVAIRHFNCTDQYYILVDDICFGNDELEIPEMISCVGESFVVTAIGDNAFSGCSYYNGDLTIPNSVTSIGSNAFNNCTGFNGTLTIGESVSSIGSQAFWDTGFTSLNYNAINCGSLYCYGYDSNGNWIEGGVFSTMNQLTTLSIGGQVQTIPAFAFDNISSLTGNLILPNTITSIGFRAFSNTSFTSLNYNAINCGSLYCNGYDSNGNWIEGGAFSTMNRLATLSIGEQVQTIPDYAFDHMSSLAGNLILPNSITSIGNNAFYGCSGFNGNLTIPNSVTSIGSNAFQGCSGFNGTLTIGESVSSIGSHAFWNTGFTSLNYNAINCGSLYCNGYDSNGNWIEGGAFSTMNRLATLSIGEQVQTIPDYAFDHMSSLAGNLILPNSITSIGNNAFCGCSGFNGNLTIPNSVTSIGSNAFQGCSGFNGNLTIPNSVTSIGSNAFQGCSGFNGTLTIGESVSSIGSHAFWNTGFTSLNYNAINCGSLYCNGYDSNGNWVEGGVFSEMSSLTSLNIGGLVQTIPDYAFANLSELAGNLILPNSLESIGDCAFMYCGGFSGNLVIPNSVISIGGGAFYQCSGFSGDLFIPNSVLSIGYEAFESCAGFSGTLTIGENVLTIGYIPFLNTNFTTLHYNAIDCGSLYMNDWAGEGSVLKGMNILNTLVFGENVQSIPDAAFYDYPSLTGTVIIPNSVTTIGNSAFYNCYGLLNLGMGSSVQTIGDYAFQNCGGISGELALPESLISVGRYAFASCDELNTINYYAINCTAMGNANEPVFYDCVSLEHINIGENVESIPNYAFKRCSTVSDMSVAAMVPPTIANSTFGTVPRNIPVEVPCGTAHDYEAAAYWSAFNNYLQNMNYTLEVAPDDPENGTVVVNKEADCDDLYAEIQAYPELGHVFAGWNEGGEIVSTDNPYSLLMDENHNLQAVFEEGLSYSVSAAALPAVAGVVRGMGNYNAGVSVTMSAMPYQGYDFVNWTENGEVVSTEPEFSFTIEANRQLVANFTSNAYHWEVDEHQFESNMTVIGVIQIEGVEQRSVTLELGAFADDVCRGRQMLTYYPQVDRYLVFITLHGNADDVFNFRLYDHETEMESTLSCLNTMTFQANGMVGTPMEPFVFGFVNRQNAEMAEGWNWFSTYIEQEGIDGLAMLEASLANNGVMVKAQEGGFVMNDAGIWLGNLNAICNEKTYLINTSAACEVQITGPNAVPAAHPLIVNANWSWIGYPSAVAVDLNEAMADFTPTDGDMIKALDCFSTYYTGMGWFGSLHTLMPGSGYMYYSYNEDPVTLTYAMGTRETLQENLTAENNHWQPNTHAYPYNMSVMAVVELDGMLLANEDYELAAFSGNECRGSVELTYAEPIDSFIAFLPVAGEEETTVSLALYNRNTGMTYQNADGFLHFEPNAVVGCLKEPYVARFSTMDQTDEFDGCVKMYPNPVASGNHFEIDMPFDTEVKVEIINALGMVVSVESSVGPKASFKVPETPGVYMVKIMAEGKGTCNRKLVVE